MYKGVEIIAEIKLESPFGFKSLYNLNDLFHMANKIGDVISIHTDPRWGGSFELIELVRRLSDLPILAKGLHETDEEVRKAVRCGADYVLVYGRVPGVYNDKCWIEPESLRQLVEIPNSYRIVWNSRNLAKSLLFGREIANKETFEQARALRYGWICQASNIKIVAEVKIGANAVLVGTHLKQFADSISMIG